MIELSKYLEFWGRELWVGDLPPPALIIIMIIISIDPVPARFISAEPSILLENTIYVTWLNAQCASIYQLIITSGSMEQTNTTTTSTEFPFPVPAPGRYMFSLSSIDYLGRSVGDPVSTEVCFTCETFLIVDFNY